MTCQVVFNVLIPLFIVSRPMFAYTTSTLNDASEADSVDFNCRLPIWPTAAGCCYLSARHEDQNLRNYSRHVHPRPCAHMSHGSVLLLNPSDADLREPAR